MSPSGRPAHRRLRLVRPDDRAHAGPPPSDPDPGPACGDDRELSAAEAAILLGVTEDDIVIRQLRGDLPVRLIQAQLVGDATGPDRS